MAIADLRVKRGAQLMRRPRFAAPMFAIAILALAFSGLISDFWVSLFSNIGIVSLVALGLVVLTGVGGMTSFGQAAFVGFGAYTTAVLTVHFGISPWLTLPISVIVTMASSLLIGAVTVRLSGHYLPLGTIAWGISFYYLFGNVATLGGHDGLSGIPPLEIAGHSLVSAREYFLVVWLFVVVAVVATRNLMRGRMGRAVRALRENTLAAESCGIRPAALKLSIFVYAAMLAGVAGWLYAHYQRSVSPGSFGITAGTEYLLMAVIGGPGRLYGAIMGSTVVILLRDQLQSLLPSLIGSAGNFESIVFGAVLVLLLRSAPDGLWSKVGKAPLLRDFVGKSPDELVNQRVPIEHGLPLLEVRDLRKVYGGLVAANDVNFAAPAGHIIGLIGPNGAGKSTTFNLVTGVSRLTSGSVKFRGKGVDNLTPQHMARLGVSRSFQHANIVADMSVLENVMLGAHLRGSASLISGMFGLDQEDEARLSAIARAQLRRTGLSDVASKNAGTISLGQLRLLEIARALALDPLLLLLDEPAAGLRVGEKKELARLLRELRQEGVAILLVEHDMDFVMSLADQLVVLNFGTKIAEGDPRAVRENPKVVEAYLGAG